MCNHCYEHVLKSVKAAMLQFKYIGSKFNIIIIQL